MGEGADRDHESVPPRHFSQLINLVCFTVFTSSPPDTWSTAWLALQPLSCTMATSPGSRPPDSSSRGSSLASFVRMEDERDFDKLGSIIPDSQAAANAFSTQFHVKRFSVPKDEVSISNMSEGFCFGEKQPPRPGQFSQRPKPEQSQVADTSRFFCKPKDVVPPPFSPNPRHAAVAQVTRAAAPLDLPELGLIGRDSSLPNSPTSHHGKFSSLPNHDEHYPQKSSPNEAPIQPGVTSTNSVIYIDSPDFPHDDLGSATAIEASVAEIESSPIDSQRVEVVAEATGSRRVAKKKELPSYQVHDNKLRLEDLKLPLPHIARVDRGRHRASPSSACGDLERPVPQAPRSTRAHSHSSRSYRSSQPPSKPGYHRESDRHHDRSQSRASNISKKRSTRRKSRPQPRSNPNRKKIAMQNVAEHWNECIQIAEAERDEANGVITRLEDEVHYAEKVLNETLQLVSEKESSIQESEARYKKLQEERSQAEKDTQRLQSEVESLRSDLAKSQKDASAIHEKYRKNRSKLNEAIAEQQDLYTRARNLFQETSEELRKEKDSRAADAKAVEQALEASHKKREELKSCIERYRAETEQEGHQKNHAISELQTKLERQQQELAREKDSAAELQARLENESTLMDMVKRLHSDLHSLKDDSDKRNEWSEKQDKMANYLSAKLGSMADHLGSRTESQLTTDEVKSMVDTLETNILSRLMSEMHNIVSFQTKAEQSASCLQDTIRSHFEELHDHMIEQQSVQSQDRKWHEDTRRVLVEHLSDISARTLETSKTCNETRDEVAELAKYHSVWCEDLQSRFSSQVAEQLQDRESKISELEEALRQVSEEWVKKLDTMRTSMLENDEQAKEYLQTAVREIRTTLEKQFREEKTTSEKDILRSEAIRDTVESQLQQVKRQLEGLSSDDPESQLLRETLVEERKRISVLQEQLAKLKGDSGANNELCKRQRQDLEAVETLKSQLEGMSEHVPHVETLNTAFNKMVDLNQIMQSTASYLSKEHHWVNEQLAMKTQAVGSSNSQRSNTGTESSYFDKQRPEEPLTLTRAQSISLKRSTSLSDLATLDVHAQGERFRRKVVVASPALDANSPAPPPSIEQEQLRRREASIPRSILRLAASSMQEGEPTRAPLSHSQYNRPVMAKVSSAGVCANPAMIEQIRSGLIQPKPRRPNWEFPTMEDFARGILSGGKNEATLGKKHNMTLVDEAEGAVPPLKRIKSEEPQEDSENVVPKDMHKPQLLRARHVIRKTYSKKQDD
ncbi:hypothetical protein FSARC_2538 [Fusarium sarcochroum]|uniref:Uncharacterized protein n=1 Tax=Fusarium sarcochroum TaxID=1208366 RepID=A0A8H4XDL2_9HYPO|nr:hypothetical protein FSARC_2538 [Fusarium sarcochroum]